jgi:hypothetical protein
LRVNKPRYELVGLAGAMESRLTRLRISRSGYAIGRSMNTILALLTEAGRTGVSDAHASGDSKSA